jgi:hypothetical protein
VEEETDGWLKGLKGEKMRLMVFIHTRSLVRKDNFQGRGMRGPFRSPMWFVDCKNNRQEGFVAGMMKTGLVALGELRMMWKETSGVVKNSHFVSEVALH